MLQSMGLQRVKHHWATKHAWYFHSLWALLLHSLFWIYVKCPFEYELYWLMWNNWFLFVNLLNRKNKRRGHNEIIEAIEPACFILQISIVRWLSVKIQSPALRNLYCEVVSLSVRLMKMSANGMRPCQMELLSPPIQLGKGVNQYNNLISSWEGGFGCGHFYSLIESPEKIIILKIYIIYTMKISFLKYRPL